MSAILDKKYLATERRLRNYGITFMASNSTLMSREKKKKALAHTHSNVYVSRYHRIAD